MRDLGATIQARESEINELKSKNEAINQAKDINIRDLGASVQEKEAEINKLKRQINKMNPGY